MLLKSACLMGWEQLRVIGEQIYTLEISQCEFHTGPSMAGLIRQGHFLGAKLRSLRKRNGLTLDELSARCVQIDAGGAPSVSYLSMVETGKRMPSAEMLDMLAGIFSKDSRWFLDENTDVEAGACAPRSAAAWRPCLWSRHSCSRMNCCKTPCRNCCRKPAPRGRQFAQLLDPRLAGNAAQQLSRHRARGRGSAASAKCP